MIRGDAEKELLKIAESKTDGWENATVFIGNQPGGYRTFLSDRTGSRVILNRTPVRGTTTFGDGPGYDHTNGKGYYMFTAAENNLNTSSAARLISYPQPGGQVICVSFWYHMFGNSIGALTFITKHASEQQTVVWMRNGTQGNTWRFADLTFNSDTPTQFIIEALPGSGQGSISIDDIIMSNSENGSCPAERECTFQGSLCGLQPQPTADFSWSRITGTTQPANSSGPAADHTLGTDQGYYLSAKLWSHPVGSRGKMTTAVMEPTPPDGECLMFWYYMEGVRVGEFNLYLQTPSTHESAVQLWTRSGDQGKHWRHGRATLLNLNTPYQVVFEAVVGEGPKRDIAIDDLTVLNGACPQSGFCDFEMDFCGWLNNPPADSAVDWDWLSGTSVVHLIPKRDHTTNSPLGHFAAFVSSQSNTEEIAQLESESMEAVDRACLEFWHYAVGWSTDRPSHNVLTVLINEPSGLRSVWNTSGYMNDTWFRERVDYKAPGLHQIILRATNPDSKEGSFAMDDVHIMRGVACDDIVLTTTANPFTSTTTAPVSSMDCTFEQGLCNWHQEVSDDSDWILSRGLQADLPWDGPQHDHTVGNNQGFYLQLNGSGSKEGDRAVISATLQSASQSVLDSGFTCLGLQCPLWIFWFRLLPSPSSPPTGLAAGARIQNG
ncbi:MAM and LDL-receptor class A domain-containing protein 1 [Thalassophryne amazonica]|uniref:MAM and LDL-receptor class A domain-containing protein 1 n=1 Tax=Thalassophryne amazonica TaxID=390379 RepID=UPI0014725784|nr:MAM and LDL-receptor class A domain-containing protein 1 [Thalassophryne amazonica]